MKRWPLLLATGAFLAQSIALYLPRVPSSGSDLPLDKVAHIAMFAVVAGLAAWAGIPARWVVGILLLQALISELVHGYLFSGRGGDIWDLVADLAGIALGLGTARLLNRNTKGQDPAMDR